MAAIPRESRSYSAPSILDRTLDISRINLEVVVFVGLMLLSIVAHLWALGHMALHHDESIHAWASWRFYTGAGSFTCAGGRTANTYCYDPIFHGPSLYSLTLFSYLLFGSGEAQARLPEAVAGILLVASAWMLRPYFGWRGMFIAAALLAFSPSLLYYTRFARHDALILLWTFWMVVGFFRWLDSGRARFLYLLAAGASLAMATHELYYILFFLFGTFLLIRVLSELLPRRRIMIGMLAILAVALVILVTNPPITDKLRAGGLALIIATVIGSGLLLLRVWDDTPLVTARALVLWRHQRGTLWTALGIMATIYVLLYSTYFADPRGIIDGLYQGIYYWLGSQHDYARGDQPWYYYLMLMPLYEPLALITSIGAAIYLFTRKSSSDEEQLTTDGAQKTVAEMTAHDEAATLEENGAHDTTVLPASARGADENGVVAERAAQPLSRSAAQAALFPLFLAFWFIGAFVAFSWAGEKMPWLLTHIALPGNLLAAWALGRMLDHVSEVLKSDDQSESEHLKAKMLLIPGAVVLLLVFLGVAVWRLFGAGEGLEGQSSLLQGLIPLLVAGALIYTVLTIGQRAGAGITLVLAGLAVAGALTIYEVHATWQVVYDHPDTPREPLIFVQSSPDVPLISQDIHELAISQTRNRRTDDDPIGGHSMPVIMDIGDEQGEYSLAWPFYWYLRDMQRIENRKADFFQNATVDSFQVAVDSKQPNGEKEFAPVVMVAVPHMTDATRSALEANYVKKYDSNLNWWFPYGNKCDPAAPGYSRFYYNSWTPTDVLTQPAPKGCGPTSPTPDKFAPPWGVLVWPFERANWYDTWRFLLYREIPDPLRIDGRQMEVWVRRDLVGSSATPAVGGGQLKLLADQAIGTPGKEAGQLDQPHGLAVDAKGNVYVSDSAAHRVAVFGPDGQLIREIGGMGSAPGQFNEPHGVAVDAQGNLYVADTWNARVDKFDANGKYLKSWGEGKPDDSGRLLTMTDGTEAGNAAAPLGFYGPRGVAVDAQGNVYVADTGNKRIVVTDGEGNFLYQWGAAGAGPGQFSEPIGLALDGQGNLYVADTWNSRVQVFGRAQDGRISPVPVVTWAIPGWQPNTYFDPFIAASPSGQVFVTVPGRDAVLYANMRGDVLLRWGGKSDDLASVTQPSGVAVVQEGRVYVVDYGGGRVLKFTLPKVADPVGAK
jgi:uncharacterized protein (TIGR03663 family)